jgi:hypothetical protein
LIIIPRLRLIGEGRVLEKELENLQGEHIFIFLTEPKPENWLPEISHLKKYVTEEKYTISDVLAYVQSLNEKLRKREDEENVVAKQIVNELNNADLSEEKVDKLKGKLIEVLDQHLKE